MQAYSCLRKNNVLTMITSMAGRREVSRSCTWRCYSAHLLFVNHRSVRLMAQGKTKGLQTKAPSARHSRKAAANTKKGKKYIPPKKPALIKNAQMHRVSLWLSLDLHEADLRHSPWVRKLAIPLSNKWSPPPQRADWQSWKTLQRREFHC